MIVVLQFPRFESSLGSGELFAACSTKGHRPVICQRRGRRYSVLSIEHYPGEVLRSALACGSPVLADTGEAHFTRLFRCWHGR